MANDSFIKLLESQKTMSDIGIDYADNLHKIQTNYADGLNKIMRRFVLVLFVASMAGTFFVSVVLLAMMSKQQQRIDHLEQR